MAHEAADVSMAVSVGIDAAVAAVHPTPTNIKVSETTLKESYVFDRYGGYIDRETGEFVDKGPFVAPKDVSFSNRVLPEATKSKQYSQYQVLKDIPGVKQGEAIPWFGQPGGDTQFELPGGIGDLIKKGISNDCPNKWI